MQPERRQHVALGLFVTLAGVFLALWGCPYIRMHSHDWLCVALFVVLLLVFIYGRADLPRRRRTLSDQR